MRTEKLIIITVPQLLSFVCAEAWHIVRNLIFYPNMYTSTTCSDTVSRCGVFCSLINATECCKTEGIVDVFQVVKALRIQKPGSVLTVVSLAVDLQTNLSALICYRSPQESTNSTSSNFVFIFIPVSFIVAFSNRLRTFQVACHVQQEELLPVLLAPS